MSAHDPRPYEGASGRTRRIPVSVPAADGSFVGHAVYVGVNVATDPELRARCLEGTLHGEGAGALAIPYVFHDPAAELFVLVVPSVRRHELQRERAALLARLAAEEASYLPAYVAAAEAVVGPQGLRRALGQGDDASELEVELIAEEPSVDGEEALLDAVELLEGRLSSVPPAPPDEDAPEHAAEAEPGDGAGVESETGPKIP
ncbi:MAG: hypothetical protein AAF447_26060 [Myxococcota bacterium]